MCSRLQQVYLQSIMSRGALQDFQARDLYHEIAGLCGETLDESNEEYFPEFISSLNKHLKPLGLEMGGAWMENSLEYWYAVVNRTPDAAAKVGSKFNPQELEYFNKIVKLLVLDEGVVSSARLLNITCEMERKISAADAQKFLKSLIKEHWLTENEGKFSAGPRFILELRPFLSEICGDDIILCKTCSEPVIQGQGCELCEVKLHPLCVAKLAKGRSEIRCPGCSAKWLHGIPDIVVPMKSHSVVRVARGSGNKENGRDTEDGPPRKRSHKSWERRK